MRSSGPRAWWRDAVGAAALCTAVALVVGSTGARAAEAVASNLDLMSSLTAQVVGELYGKFQGSLDGRAVRLKPYGVGEEYQFVTNVFTSELTQKGVPTLAPLAPSEAPASQPSTGGAAGGVASGGSAAGDAGAGGANAALEAMHAQEAPSSDENSLVLQYQNIAFGVTYAGSYRSHLVGGRQVKRRAGVRVLATLSDSRDGKVLWVGEATRESQDEFEHGDAARIEQGNYQFTRPVMPPSGWGRYAEPVFVTGIVVGLIYLFFSNQSDH